VVDGVGAAAGAGAAVASSKASKGDESLCRLQTEACDCCDASVRGALYSGAILDVLDTAALPEQT
jgi:hypothetical protein